MREIVNQNTNKRNKNSEKVCDKIVYGQNLVIRDRMLMKNISRRVGGGKLQSFWDNEIYKVVSENKDLPIYQGQPEKGCSKMKSVHHNL